MTHASRKSVDGQSVSSAPFEDLYVSMPRTPRLTSSRWFAVREIVVMVAMFIGYEQVRHLTRNDTGSAMEHARQVVRVERNLHVFGEHRLQETAMSFDGLIQFLNHYYVFVHFPVSFAFIGWVIIRHRDVYTRFRNWFLAVTLSALAIHVAYPLAPPRMLEDNGFVDTLQRYGPSIYSQDTNESVANQFAAMPSLHFGWALLIALMFIRIKRTRWSYLALAHPAITLLAIVATANHYLADAAVAGALVLGVDAALTVGARAVRRETVPQLPLYVTAAHVNVGAVNLPAGTLAARGESPASTIARDTEEATWPRPSPSPTTVRARPSLHPSPTASFQRRRFVSSTPTCSSTTPRTCRPRLASQPSPTSTATQGSSDTGATRSSNSPSSPHSSKSRTSS
jgi:hypothetical protein